MQIGLAKSALIGVCAGALRVTPAGDGRCAVSCVCVQTGLVTGLCEEQRLSRLLSGTDAVCS